MERQVMEDYQYRECVYKQEYYTPEWFGKWMQRKYRWIVIKWRLKRLF